jgi:transcription elongation factor GreA
MSYQLVNAAEARPGTGRLSIESPVGQAVLGRHAGDEVSVSAPSGLVRFRLESIEA